MSKDGFFKVNDEAIMTLCAARSTAEAASRLSHALTEILNSVEVEPSLELLQAVADAMGRELEQVVALLIAAEENTRSGK